VKLTTRYPRLVLHACLWLAVGCGDQKASSAPDSGAPAPDGAAGPVGCTGCTVLTGAGLFDGTSTRTGALVLKGGRIEQVLFGTVTVTAGTEVDLSGKTVLPGLLDLHVHSAGSAGPSGYSPSELLHEPHLRAMLRAGVTGYLDLGSSARRIFAYRARIKDGVMRGPALLAAGPLVTTPGGHPCYTGSPVGDSCLLVDKPADVSRLEPLFAEKPDVLKLVIEGGTKTTPLPRMDTATIAAVVAAARKHGVKVVAHVSAAQDVEDGLDAGVRIFAHLPAYDLMSDALLARLVKERALIIPTVVVYENLYLVAHGKLPLDQSALAADVPAGVLSALTAPTYQGYSASYRTWTAEIWDNAQKNLRACVKSGVALAAGTDAGNPATFHGLALQRELELYVEAGMSPARAIAAATSDAAAALGLSDRGALEVGQRADLLVVQGDPLTDIANTRKVAAVYLLGEPVDRDGLRLGGAASLTLQPVTDRKEGAICLASGECASPLVCDQWDARCTASCNPQSGAGCKIGSACFPLTADYSKGYCFLGDGCDLFGQDCPNSAACVWLGNATTSCWYAAEDHKAGEACGPSSSCARGLQCNSYAGTCYELCDPAQGICSDSGQSCQDLSQLAGQPAGQCT
jgi:imidazolonepropionase-like amidohydrolase